MTREGGTPKLVIVPLRMGKGPQACHCEAPQGPWQSRSTRRNTGKPRRIRRCLLEIATSGLRPPRNDTGGRHSQACHCAPPGGESPPDLSLRGSAGAVAISQYTPGTQESPGEIVSACLRFPRRFAPRNDTGGRHSQVCPCAPPGEAGYQICHCEAPQEPRQSRSTRSDRRKAIGESATASPRFPRRFAPRNDKPGSIARSAKPLYNLPACKALTGRRYRRNWLVRFYRYLVRTGSAFPRLPRRLAPSSQ